MDPGGGMGRAHPLDGAAHSESINKRRRYSDIDPHAPPPSRVVHARSVPDGLLSTEMTGALSKFGAISHAVLMPKIRQALVEFESVASAQACVAEAKERGIMLRDRAVFFNFSKSQEINRGQSSRGNTNRILLMTVQNAIFPITCDIIHTICNKIGAAPCKIVMVRKRGVQALVEFGSVQTATQVLEQLNFQDIYKGCCTLKIEYSHNDSLNVQFNSDDTKDYTNPGLPTRSAPPPRAMGGSAPMAAMMHPAAGAGHFHMGAAHPPRAGYDYTGYGHALPGQHAHPAMAPAAPGMPAMDPYGGRGPGGPGMGMAHPAYGHGYGAAPQPQHYGGDPHARPMGMPGTVLIFYELNMTKFNCERLFNLVCLYANPTMIKFVMSKPGMAMVQVSDPMAATTALEYITGMPLFGSPLQCGLSKHDYIAPSRQMSALTDGTPSTLDCAASRNHRFRSGAYQKSRLCPPSTVLHFFNVPKGTAHATLVSMFETRGAPKPLAIYTFPEDPKGKNSDRGLMEFASVSEAAECLLVSNHAELTTPEGRVYTSKFSFSNNHIEPDAIGVTRFGDSPAAAAPTVAPDGGQTAAPPVPGDADDILGAPPHPSQAVAAVAPADTPDVEEETDFTKVFLSGQ